MNDLKQLPIEEYIKLFNSLAENTIEIQDQWISDPTKTPVLLLMISHPKTTPKCLFYCFTILKLHIRNFYQHWTVENRLKILDFLLNSIIQNSAFLVQFSKNGSPILNQFCNLIALLFCYGSEYGVSLNIFWEKLTSIFDGNLAHILIGFKILYEIISCIGQFNIFSLRSKLLSFFIQAITFLQTISLSSQNEEIILPAIKTAFLTFYTEAKWSSFSKFSYNDENNYNIQEINIGQKIYLSSEWIEPTIDPQLIQLLFQISINCGSNCATVSLEFLSQLALIDTFSNSRSAKAKYFSDFLDILLNYLSSHSPLNNIEIPLSQLLVNIISTIEEIRGPNFVFQNEYQLSLIAKDLTEALMTPENITLLTSQYLLAFWNKIPSNIQPPKFIENDSSLPPFNYFIQTQNETKMKVVQQFIVASLSFISTNLSDADEFFFSDSLEINKSLKYVRDIISPFFSEKVSFFISQLETGASLFENTLNTKPENFAIAEAQLAFMIDLSMTISQKKGSNEQNDDEIDAIAQLWTPIFSIFTEYLPLTPKMHLDGLNSKCYLDRIFLRFAYTFQSNYPWFTKNLSNASIIFTKIGAIVPSISKIEDAYSFIISSLLNILQNFPPQENEILINTAICFEQIMSPSRDESRLITKLDIVQNLISIRATTIFPFLNTVECRTARIIFHAGLVSILCLPEFSTLRDQFLHTYDHILDNFSIMSLCFFRDFIGYFQRAQTASNYQIFFNYLKDYHFNNLIACLPQIIQQPILTNEFLHFWYWILKDDRQRIKFKHHSVNGLRLFQMTVTIVEQVANSIISQVADKENDNISKFFIRILRIIYCALSASYVPFNAFLYYHDELPDKLFLIFKQCLATSTFRPSTLSQLPKLENEVMRVATCIADKHIIYLTKESIGLAPIIFQIFKFGLKSVNNISMETAINGVQILFDHINVENQPSFDFKILNSLILSLWEIALHQSKINLYRVKVVIRELIIKGYGNIEAFKEMVSKVLQPDKKAFLQKTFDKFTSNLDSALQLKEGEFINQLLDLFLRDVASCLTTTNHLSD